MFDPFRADESAEYATYSTLLREAHEILTALPSRAVDDAVFRAVRGRLRECHNKADTSVNRVAQARYELERAEHEYKELTTDMRGLIVALSKYRTQAAA